MGALALSLCAGAAQAAQIVCKQPVMPVRPPIATTTPPAKVAVLPCLARNNCKRGEVDKYNAQIDAYNASLAPYDIARDQELNKANAYFRAIDQYIDELNTYVQCERREIRALFSTN
jgi:hypothetical protein